MIGLDIAKHVFYAHGADERGRALFSKRISRGKLLDFFAAQPSCTVALEAFWWGSLLGSPAEAQRIKRFVARTDAGSQTAHAGNCRARKQDGANSMGATRKKGKLQSSGRSQDVSLLDLRSSEV
jgi:transposase